MQTTIELLWDTIHQYREEAIKMKEEQDHLVDLLNEKNKALNTVNRKINDLERDVKNLESSFYNRNIQMGTTTFNEGSKSIRPSQEESLSKKKD